MIDFKKYFTNPIIIAPPRENLQAMKDLEEIIILCRFIASLLGFIAAFLQVKEGVDIVSLYLLIMVMLSSIIFYFFNKKISTPNAQMRLSIVSLITNATIVFFLIFLNLDLYMTTAHAGFIFVTIEAILRFGIKGTLAMCVIFPLGLAMVMISGHSKYEFGFAAENAKFDLFSSFVLWNGIMLSIALIFGLVVRGAQKERKLNDQLVKEKALTEERQRIAHDLHDTVIKTLHGLTLETHILAKHITSPANKEKARYIETICQRSGRELRDIIYELRKEERDEGVLAKISGIVDDWKQTTDIETTLSTAGQDRKLPLNISYNLRNILSEALTNIEKHAQATEASIDVRISESDLNIDIRDNGCGTKIETANLEQMATAGRFGLLGMRERTEQLGGQFSIENRKGTHIKISIPTGIADK